MAEPLLSIDECILKFLNLFREIRRKKNLSLECLSDILRNQYGLEVSSNMLGKIERNESKIQIEVFLALMHFYNVKLSDGNESFETESEPLETEIVRLCKINPDLEYILEHCRKYALHFEFINHLRNVVKSSLPLLETSDRTQSQSLKAASFFKKKKKT